MPTNQLEPDENRRWTGSFLAAGILTFALISTFIVALTESKPGEVAGALATIIGGAIAVGAAIGGGYLINKQIRSNQQIEHGKVQRKLRSARAGLSLVLHDLDGYLKECAGYLIHLYDNVSPIPINPFGPPALPQKAVADLLALVEVADQNVGDAAARLLEIMQVHQARMLSLQLLTSDDKGKLMRHAAEAAVILASVDNLYDYARRRREDAPAITSGDVALASRTLVPEYGRFPELDGEVELQITENHIVEGPSTYLRVFPNASSSHPD